MSDDDAFGRRPGPRMITIVAGSLALLCVAFLAGLTAGGSSSARGAGTGGTSPATGRAGTSSPGAVPASSEMSPASAARGPTSGASTPAGSTGSPAGSAGRPHLNATGVLAGYARTAAGAVAAAGNYTAVLYVQANRTRSRELALLSSIAASGGGARRMGADFASEDAALAQLLDVADLQQPDVIAYGHPVGYRVESAGGTAATVDVYVVGGQGLAGAPDDSAGAGETFYEVDEVQLVWRGDWRLVNWSHLVQDNGPVLASVAGESFTPFVLDGAAAGAR